MNNPKSLDRDQIDMDCTTNIRFNTKESVYASQYASLYFTRLNLLRPRVLTTANTCWANIPSSPHHIPRIVNVRPGVLCYIIGTLFLDMPEKPNILDDVAREEWTAAPEPKAKYVSDKDQLLLEDESGRILLTGDILKTTVFMTGVIAGLLGSENEDGEFQIIDVCYASFHPQPPLSIAGQDEGSWIALVSGLSLGGSDEYDIRYDLLSDFLTGESGSDQDHQRAMHISRLLICGNTLKQLQVSAEARHKSRTKFGSGDTSEYEGWTVDVADQFLASLCRSLPVDVMSGPTDPVTSFLPQPSIHSSIFRTAGHLTSLSMVTNPFTCMMDGVSVLADSGQSLDDLFRMTTIAQGVDLAGEILRWGHMAPTAPDTLLCHPFAQDDPLIITTRPHLQIVGNQPRFETKVVQLPGGLDADGSTQQLDTTRIVLVPSFATTGTLVLVNLATLDCKTVEFGMAV
ncbi:hypothetical protein BSLG_000484 [Batrachochytrium salamandrivorans]|nr:hypothetical protein BSLG_000484 [Batrachochytrium salamandrivorans]